MKRLLGATAALFAASSAQASTWYLLANASTHAFMTFVEGETLVRYGDSVTVWEKAVFDRDAVQPSGVYSIVSHEEYACGRHTSRVLTATQLDKDRGFLRSLDQLAPVEDVAPDTAEDAVLKAVCAPGFPKTQSGDWTAVGDVYEFAARVFAQAKIPMVNSVAK